VDHGYDTELWTLKILVALIEETFEIRVSDSTVAVHLPTLGLSCQVPKARARDLDPKAVERVLTRTWPMIRRLTKKRGPSSSSSTKPVSVS